MAEKSNQLKPTGVAGILAQGRDLSGPQAQPIAPPQSPEVPATPTQSIFDFGQPAPAPQEQQDLGLLGNVGTILNILGGVTQSPELSAIGGGLLGVMQRQQQKELIERKNQQALIQFESIKSRAKQAFDLATEFGQENPNLVSEVKIAQLQAQQGDTKGAFSTLRKAAGGERLLRDFEARANLKRSLTSEATERAVQAVVGGADPDRALADQGIKLDKRGRRSFKKNVEAAKQEAQGQQPGTFELLIRGLFESLKGAGLSQPPPQADPLEGAFRRAEQVKGSALTANEKDRLRKLQQK